jgi:hypothetical protein
MLEKNLDSYFERPAYISGRNVGEDEVVSTLCSAAGDVHATDLHKGIKALWANGFMDAPYAKYKTALATASQAMDGSLGIREHNPTLYAEVLESPLFKTAFSIAPTHGLAVETLSVDPMHGQIGFSRYCEVKGDSDRVIDRILEANV